MEKDTGKEGGNQTEMSSDPIGSFVSVVDYYYCFFPFSSTFVSVISSFSLFSSREEEWHRQAMRETAMVGEREWSGINATPWNDCYFDRSDSILNLHSRFSSRFVLSSFVISRSTKEESHLLIPFPDRLLTHYIFSLEHYELSSSSFSYHH